MNSLEGVEKIYVSAGFQVDEILRVTTSEEHWWVSNYDLNLSDEQVLKIVNRALDLGFTVKTK